MKTGDVGLLAGLNPTSALRGTAGQIGVLMACPLWCWEDATARPLHLRRKYQNGLHEADIIRNSRDELGENYASIF